MLIPGHRVSVRVPYDGDPDLFDFLPSNRNFNPPRRAGLQAGLPPDLHRHTKTALVLFSKKPGLRGRTHEDRRLRPRAPELQAPNAPCRRNRVQVGVRTEERPEPRGTPRRSRVQDTVPPSRVTHCGSVSRAVSRLLSRRRAARARGPGQPSLPMARPHALRSQTPCQRRLGFLVPGSSSQGRRYGTVHHRNSAASAAPAALPSAGCHPRSLRSNPCW